MGQDVGDITHDEDVQELLVDQPRNTLVPFAKFVVLFVDAADDHVGKDMLDAVVHVNVVVCADCVIVAVVPLDFFIVPVPPRASNVILFVLADQCA